VIDGVTGGSGVAVRGQVATIARRSIIRTLRQPATVVPSILFPLALMAVNSGGLDSATELPGFPSDSFYAFALAVPFIQGALFATMNAGTDLARDIQTGFLNRLSLTPMRGAALLMGQLAGIVVLALGQAVCYLAVGLAIGVRPESGPLGWLVLLLLAALIALGFGAIGATLALRTGSGEAVQGMFPVLFVFLFISSMNMPRHLIEIDWFRIAATVNPISYLLEGVRSLIIEGWNWEALALGFGFTLAVTVVAIVAATAALRVRMERT
jgi:ABC-2 type transport system permease protein